jgi:hypothetical protein
MKQRIDNQGSVHDGRERFATYRTRNMHALRLAESIEMPSTLSHTIPNFQSIDGRMFTGKRND